MNAVVLKNSQKILLILLIQISCLDAEAFNSPHNHRKSITSNIAYGPSVYSQDLQKIFNYRKHMWGKLRQKANSIILLSLMLDNTGLYNNPEYADDVALGPNQINHLREIQRRRNFKVIVEGGNGLNSFCNMRNNEDYLAQKAAQQEMLLYNRLLTRGVRIHEVSIDGPFLRLLSMSRKDHGCHLQRKGFNIQKATRIVAHYTRHLKRFIERSNGGKSVKINLVINLLNWRVDNQMEIAWGSWKNQPINLRTVLNQYQSVIQSSNIYPSINEVVLDYPYHFVNGHRHRKIVSRRVDNESLCGRGVNCVTTTHEDAFLSKVSKLMGIINRIKGRPKLSFIVNTKVSNPIHKCILDNMTGSALKPFNNNRCLTRNRTIKDRIRAYFASRHQRLKDQEYINHSRDYYDLIINHLPSNIRLGSVYFESWHPNPRSSENYSHRIFDIVREIGR